MATYGVIVDPEDGKRSLVLYPTEAEARAFAQAKALEGATATVVRGVARYVPQPRQVATTEL